MFVFQACYGTSQDKDLDIRIDRQGRSDSTGIPIEGIKVSINNTQQYIFTDSEGKFSFYTEISEYIKLLFQEVDAADNGSFQSKDTLLPDTPESRHFQK